jgi:hypothetical protein
MHGHADMAVEPLRVDVASLPQVSEPRANCALWKPHFAPNRRWLHLEAVSIGGQPSQQVEVEPDARAHAAQVESLRMLDQAAVKG